MVTHLYDSSFFRAAVYRHFHLNPATVQQRTKYLSVYYVTRLGQNSSELTINQDAISYARQKVQVGRNALN